MVANAPAVVSGRADEAGHVGGAASSHRVSRQSGSALKRPRARPPVAVPQWCRIRVDDTSEEYLAEARRIRSSSSDRCPRPPANVSHLASAAVKHSGGRREPDCFDAPSAVANPSATRLPERAMLRRAVTSSKKKRSLGRSTRRTSAAANRQSGTWRIMPRPTTASRLASRAAIRAASQT
jgi:hypothetical protein